MTKRERKKLISIITVVAIVLTIIIASVLIYIYVNTDMLKSNKTLFFKYMEQNIGNIETAINMLNDDSLRGSRYEETTKIKTSFTEKIGTSSENTNNAINKLQLVIDEQKDDDQNYDHKNIKLNNSNQTELNIEYLKEDNNYGIKLADLFKEYMSVENGDIKGILGKAGISQDVLDKIPDTMLTSDTNIFDELKLSEEEKENLKTRYINVIEKGVSNKKFKKGKNETITIDGKSVNANSYTLSMTKEELNSLYISFLETLKEDDIILEKISYIQDVLDKAKLILSGPINLKDKFVGKIDETISYIKKNNIGNESAQIIVYENLKQTVRTTIKRTDYQVNFDVLQSDEDFATFNVIKTGETENLKNITIRNTKDKSTINIEDNNQQIPYTIDIESVKTQNTNSVVKNTNIVYKKSDYKVEVNKNSEIRKNPIDAQTRETLQKNNVQLDTMEDQQLAETIKTVEDQLKAKIEQIKTNISEADINSFQGALGIVPYQSKLEQGGEITEAERTRFNSKFQFLNTGEKLDKEKLLEGIPVFAENLLSLEVPSNTQIKVIIDRYQNNPAYVENLKNYVEKNKKQSYTVNLEYDNETGLVNAIIINIINEEKK